MSLSSPSITAAADVDVVEGDVVSCTDDEDDDEDDDVAGIISSEEGVLYCATVLSEDDWNLATAAAIACISSGRSLRYTGHPPHWVSVGSYIPGGGGGGTMGTIKAR